MTTTATGSIRFGGSGFGPEYISRRKRNVQGQDPEKDQAREHYGSQKRSQEELEVFLFTVKDPIRSALGQLMSLIKTALIENPEYMDSMPEIISGPLGYTSVRAVRPVAFAPTKTIFKSVTR